jgi:uncharacterized protein YcgI (DUF1989 family)
VGLAALAASCPNFEEPEPYHAQSPVSVEAFQIFAAALEGITPISTTENMNDLLLL